MKLIKTDKYLLCIDKNAEINKNDLFFDMDWVIHTKVYDMKNPYQQKIIAYLPIKKDVEKLSVLLMSTNVFPTNPSIDSEGKRTYQYKYFYEDINEMNQHSRSYDNEIDALNAWFTYKKCKQLNSFDSLYNAYTFGYQQAQNKLQLLSFKEFLEKYDLYPKEFIPVEDSDNEGKFLTSEGVLYGQFKW